MKRITLKDIARKTNVTVSTVSAALNGTGRISDEKKKLITDTAAEMGFMPNLAAKILKGDPTNMLGLVMSSTSGSIVGHGFYMELQERFIHECNIEQMRPQIEINGKLELPATLKDGFASGIIHAGYIFDELKDWLNKHKSFPFVSFEEPWEHCVLSEYSLGVFNALQYLAATGHRRVATICGPKKFNCNQQVIDGFDRGISEFCLDKFENMLQCQITERPDDEHDRENIGLLNNLINSEQRPDALILSGRKLTSTAIFHLLSNGIRIPEDISIISIFSGWEAESIYPNVSAIQKDLATLTTEAMKILLRLNRKMEIVDKVVTVPATFVKRNTVMPRF